MRRVLPGPAPQHRLHDGGVRRAVPGASLHDVRHVRQDRTHALDPRTHRRIDGQSTREQAPSAGETAHRAHAHCHRRRVRRVVVSVLYVPGESDVHIG